MSKKKDYAIEVYGAPATTWLAACGDEDEEGDKPNLTTDPELADRHVKFNDARHACKVAASRYPTHSFRVGLIE